MNDLSSAELLKSLRERRDYHNCMADAINDLISEIECKATMKRLNDACKKTQASSAHAEDAIKYMSGEYYGSCGASANVREMQKKQNEDLQK